MLKSKEKVLAAMALNIFFHCIFISTRQVVHYLPNFGPNATIDPYEHCLFVCLFVLGLGVKVGRDAHSGPFA